MSPVLGGVANKQCLLRHTRPSQHREAPRCTFGSRSCASGAGPSPRCDSQPSTPQQHRLLLHRRDFLAASLTAAVATVLPAKAFTPPPSGFRLHQDKLDGYQFFYPADWVPLTSSGNDIFYRNPYDVNENLFVSISSPSSSRYTSVENLGSPDKAAQNTKEQYLSELMSTRLGVRREAEVLSASKREGPDGKLYYDLQTAARSYASRQQLSVTQREVNDAIELEWDRRYITVLGVANKRLYEFRLQTSRQSFEQSQDLLLTVAQSFRCKEVDV